MKREMFFFILGLLFLGPQTTLAYNSKFYSGDLYYKITGPNTVEVTYPYDRYHYLTTAIIPNSVVDYDGNYYTVTGIGYSAFYNCTGLTSVTIPESVTSIGEYAFYNCTGLTSVTIPESVTSIGSGAFSGCTGLTSIIIPESVTSIGSRAFSACSGLVSIVVEDGNSVYDSRNNCNAIIETATNTLIAGCQNTIIPESVTSIGDRAFHGCSGLTSITIPNSVMSIGDYAFSDCTGLSVTIPNSVTTIGFGAFENVLNIVYNGTATGKPWGAKATNGYVDGNFVYENATKTKIIACNSSVTKCIVPEGVTSIGERAFSGCSSLSSIVFPSTLTEIGYSAFSSCDSLSRVDCWAVEPPQCNGNPFSYKNVYNRSLYVPKQSIETYTATYPWNEVFRKAEAWYLIYPIGIVKEQLKNGFYYDLDTVNITASLVGAKDKTIRDLTVLDDIRWQGEIYPITEIGSGAFSSYSELHSVNVGKNVQYIGSSAFASSSITSIVLPEGLKYIGNYCFSSCEALTSLSIPNTVDSIGERICYHCYYLTTVSLGKGLKKIGDGAFWYCSRLASLHLPDSVTEVPADLCFYCKQLRTVSMGNITSIGENAFTACINLLSIDVKAPIPPVCAEQAFSGEERGENVPYDAVITVPCYTSDAYRTALHWNQFYNYQEQYFYFDAVSEDDEKGRVFITQKPTCDEPVAQIKAVPMTGYQFKEWSDGNTENPRTLIAEMEMKLIALFQSLTAIDNTETKDAALVQKIMCDGQVYILRGDKTYTLIGQELR